MACITGAYSAEREREDIEHKTRDKGGLSKVFFSSSRRAFKRNKTRAHLLDRKIC